MSVLPVGILSEEAFGSAHVCPTIKPVSVSTGGTLGNPTIAPGPVYIQVSGLPSGEAFGDPTTTQFINPEETSSGETFGTPHLIWHVLTQPPRAQANAAAKAPSGLSMELLAAIAEALGEGLASDLGIGLVPGVAEATASAPTHTLLTVVVLVPTPAEAGASALPSGNTLSATVAEAIARGLEHALAYGQTIESSVAEALAAALPPRVRARWLRHLPRQARVLTIITADGERLPLEPPFAIADLTGTTTPQANISLLHTPLKHGAVYSRSTYQTRQISLGLTITSGCQHDLIALRRVLTGVVNPLRGPLALEVAYDFTTETFTCYNVTLERGIDLAFSATDPAQRWKTALALVAHDPFWYGSSQEERFLPYAFRPELQFPATFPIVFGVTAGRIDELRGVEVGGAFEVPVQVVLTGPLSIPIVENRTTGKKLALNYVIPPGRTITIDTATREVLDAAGHSYRGYLSSDSNLASFTLLPSGDGAVVNSLWVYALNCTTSSSIAVTWRGRYLMTP